STPFVPIQSIGKEEITWEAHTSLEKYIEFYSGRGAGFFWVVMSMLYEPKVIVEFGTACGFATNLLAKMNPQAIIYSIDHSKTAGTADRETGIIAKSNKNVKLVIGNSQEFHCSDVDLCFIDSDHRKGAVLSDSHMAWKNRNVDRDWCIVWDDYTWSSVKEAVDCFVSKMKDHIPFIGRTGPYLHIGTKELNVNPKQERKES
ncbi:hypothetical protein LCGC14_1528300, partial [marine sediment metagenome]